MWNQRMVATFAEDNGRRIFVCPSVDTISKQPLTNEQVAAVAALSPTDQNDVPQNLEVVVGMRCMVTANLATTLGVANGSCGRIVGICVARKDEHLLDTSTVRAIHAAHPTRLTRQTNRHASNCQLLPNMCCSSQISQMEYTSLICLQMLFQYNPQTNFRPCR